jgi:hypothetical protein
LHEGEHDLARRGHGDAPEDLANVGDTDLYRLLAAKFTSSEPRSTVGPPLTT